MSFNEDEEVEAGFKMGGESDDEDLPPEDMDLGLLDDEDPDKDH